MSLGLWFQASLNSSRVRSQIKKARMSGAFSKCYFHEKNNRINRKKRFINGIHKNIFTLFSNDILRKQMKIKYGQLFDKRTSKAID
ncbi:hypothetical protein BpHYR1_052826 [Brachionus plicatilis]|uniref:Uncharacterized protein n=1 Tax=Brachionus plicatilis TaxID=10195 RepID=A0A3M7P9P2_BRAPC|nr:hypothetical protein BpHYR1_052826 [Brachionus plicatilis]